MAKENDAGSSDRDDEPTEPSCHDCSCTKYVPMPNLIGICGRPTCGHGIERHDV